MPLKKTYHRLLSWIYRHHQSKQDIQSLLNEAAKQHLIDQYAYSMLNGVLTTTDMHARDIMIPRSQMVVINAEMSLTEALPIITQSAHSRFPVVDDNLDQIMGILLAKDLLAQLSDQNENMRISALLRPALFIPESKRLDILLREFRTKHNHMAMVINEYGGIAGLVTIEDVLEQIVGNIEDEHDHAIEIPNIKPMGERSFIVDSLTPIAEFNRFFETDYRNDEFDTIGGLVLQSFSRMPKRGEKTRLGSFDITVLNASKRHIELLKVNPHDESS